MRLRKMAAGILAAAMAAALLPRIELSGLISAAEYKAGTTETEQISAVPGTAEINAISSSKEWEYFLLEDLSSVVLTKYLGSDKNVIVPSTVNDYTVKELRRTFDSNKTIESVTIPDTVEKIDSYTFSNCSELKSIVIPDTVTSIGQGAFSQCSSLESVEIPTGIESIERSTFYQCEALQSIILPNTITSIGEYAFYKCTSLTSVEIPNSVTSMGKSVFSVCTSLKSVNISTGLTSISKGAFSNCDALETIEIPDNITSIEEDAFLGCRSLPYVIIPDSVTSLEYRAFSGCSSMEYVIISNNLETIGERAFAADIQLKSVEIPDSVTSIEDQAFAVCQSLSSIVIPESVTSIGNGVFSEYPASFKVYGYSDSYAAQIFSSRFVALDDPSKIQIDGVTGIVVEADGATLDGLTLETKQTLFDEDLKSYSIALKDADGNDVNRLSGTVNVTIPVFSRWNGNPYLVDILGDVCKVYRLDADDTYINMNATYNKSCLSFTTNKFGEYITTIKDFGNNYDDDSDTTTSNTFTDEETGVKVVDENGVLPKNAKMYVRYSDINIESGDVSYEISFKAENGEECDPAGDFEIWLPVPEEFRFDKNFIKVYMLIGGGRHHEFQGEYQDGFMVFKTPMLGVFHVEDTMFSVIDTPMPGPDPDPDPDPDPAPDPDPDTDITVTDNETGISVSGKVPEGAQLVVAFDTENSTDTKLIYDISITKDGEEIQPEGTVTVKIPVPEGLQDKASELKVYHLVNGEYTDMNAKLENGYLVFTTDHFSVYVITPDTITDDNNGDDDNNDDDNKGDDTTTDEPAPTVPAAPSGNFYVPETTTAAATTTEAVTAAPADIAAVETTAVTTTAAAAVTAAPADTNNSSDDTTQPAASENNSSDNNTADNGASNVGNDGAANDKGENPDTGSAIAIVPVIVAAAAVSFFAYKRKK